jgi:hypothetical protein
MNELRALKEEKLKRLYRRNPVAYAEQVLGVSWWSKQQEIAEALVKHKRVLVKASHSIGKTHLAGGLVNWFFDCFSPGIALTTAPTKAQVEDLMWKEVRVQRKGRPGLMPKSPRMETAPDHFAAGYTANDATSFQGRHEESLLIVFDEATGIDGEFFDAGEGMMTGDDCYWLGILNPTDTSSRAYQEEQEGNWHVITVSAMDHPNIAAELQGLPAPYPAAVRLGWLQDRIKRWCTPLTAESKKKVIDFEFPPGSGNWHRPGPLFEGRVLGRWPSQSTTSVWAEGVWNACLLQKPIPDLALEIGCDVARFGDDYTSIVVRRGGCVLHHETHNGWSTSQTAGRLKQLAKQFAKPGEDPKKVLIKVDDDGVGGGVTDQGDDYNFVPVSGASKALEAEDYPNRRSELWFAVAVRADEGELDLSRLEADSLKEMKRQAMAPTWKVDASGRRVVEPKDQTKKRIGRSPDDMDAMNLAFAPPPPKPVWEIYT